MKKYFFTARNIEDYRKKYSRSLYAQKLAQEMGKDAPLEKFEQELFRRIREDFFGVPKNFSEAEIVGETNIPGLRLDFNFGLRLDVPEGNFRVRISDFDSETIIFDRKISGVRLISVDTYFIRWHVEVFLNDKKIFSHVLNLEGQPVAIIFDKAILGDTLAYLRFVREFKKIHRCELSICMLKKFRELAAHFYPEIKQIDEINLRTYATYYPLMVQSVFPLSPVDIRNLPIERAAGMVFGINTLPEKPLFKPTAPPVTNEPYVCIAVQASYNRKTWLYPRGWDIVVSYLRSLGYRVFCIDRDAARTNDGMTIRKPEDAEDFTGNLPLLERANMLYHAEFFVGLGSGLSWLADAVNCPVVLISGFSQDWAEFYTPYRVANRLVCNGCFNDIRIDFLRRKRICPYHDGKPRELECQKKISPRQVLNAIERLIIDKGLTPPVAMR